MSHSGCDVNAIRDILDNPSSCIKKGGQRVKSNTWSVVSIDNIHFKYQLLMMNIIVMLLVYSESDLLSFGMFQQVNRS